MPSLPIASHQIVTFDELPGWADDAHLAAFETFLNSSRRLLATSKDRNSGQAPASGNLLSLAERSLGCADRVTTNDEARKFFEEWFHPHRVCHERPAGLVTGYYEPVLQGARKPSDVYTVPLLRRPGDLVNLVSESERGKFADQLTHGRRTEKGVVPYATRAEIENGALKDQSLDFIWLRDPIEAYFLHVEGSGIIAFEDGTQTRVTYDGKNGHHYTSIGQYLIETGDFTADDMTFAALKTWLQADVTRARRVMQKNQSYIFFRELTAEEPDSPIGVLQIPLTAHRSLAIDTRYHEIGLPIYVTSPSMAHVDEVKGLRRLMIAQDVGSAIRGPERGDIFFGSGESAGDAAGQTQHAACFFALKPKGIER